MISSLPGSASRTHVESLGKPHDSTSVPKALPGKLDTKTHSPCILYVAVCVFVVGQASLAEEDRALVFILHFGFYVNVFV